jgi:hypothetical protein
MAFIGESAWVMKSARGIKSTTKPKAISHSKQGILSLKEDQQKALHREGAAR